MSGSVHKKLTCAVWSHARPCAVCQTLSCRRASEVIAFHARIYNRVGEGCSIHPGNTAVSRGPGISTLYRWKKGEREEKRGAEGQRYEKQNAIF